jgi:hypothetical protein
VSALHITNGHHAAGLLGRFLPDPVTVTADALFEGPAPAADGDEWYRARAGHLGGGVAARTETIHRDLAAWDRQIADAFGRMDEIVLWFEHDLFDQLLLIRTLDLVARSRHPGTKVTLICIDRFPGVERFVGLGQLSVAQLATLTSTRQPVSDEALRFAARAWLAFRAPHPAALLECSRPDGSGADPLPFARAALRRFFEEYPSTSDGLSRSARQVLRALAPGTTDGESLFAATQASEERPFMGDWSLFGVVRALARSRHPLARVLPDDDAIDLRGHAVAITDVGREVLAGRADAVTLNGIDEWRGGVRLFGSDRSPWRWNAALETLVSLEA